MATLNNVTPEFMILLIDNGYTLSVYDTDSDGVTYTSTVGCCNGAYYLIDKCYSTGSIDKDSMDYYPLSTKEEALENIKSLFSDEDSFIIDYDLKAIEIIVE